ncbi:MAG: hypothetical protein IT558_06255 [Alphaproteobacteria bacterium]|nr:hypothetical protein [Alphaproteobacteria bacterium]
MMALQDPSSAGGLLTILFTELAMLIIFHGPVGHSIMGALGLESAAHVAGPVMH